ncbi:MAG: thiosulfate oxidation carrier complex protein SoxZ [Epsilonproteobacteria bacterium]|nr:thiosulfate oxidation carrier complex protein SoxZ [Campylobacterota bacterium]
MRVKAKIKGDVVKVKCMAKHPMMTYDIAEKKTGSRDNANFITHWDGKVNGKTVFDASTSQFLSKNPIVKYEFKAAGFKKGDKLVMTWVDLKGKTKTKKATIK